MQELYEKQGAKGFYSRVPLQLRPLSHWQASLERLNPFGDYVHDNVVLVALEFNTASQWNLQKIAAIPSLIQASANITMDDLNRAKQQPKRNPKRIQRSLLQNNVYYCYDCEKWISVFKFYPSHLTSCKLCRVKYQYEYRNSLRGFIKHMMANARWHSKSRKSTKEDTRNECTITDHDVFHMLEKQMFRCKYSGIPMTFKPNMDWMCSMERLDNMKGYSKE
eukprot:847307_1